MGAEDGFTLLEVVCVVAIISLVAAIILPAIPRGTPRARIEAYALETASLLKADRFAANGNEGGVIAVLALNFERDGPGLGVPLDVDQAAAVAAELLVAQVVLQPAQIGLHTRADESVERGGRGALVFAIFAHYLVG